MSVKPIRSSVQHLLSAAAVVVSYVAAVFISRYLRIEPESLVRILAFLTLLLSVKYRKTHGRLKKPEMACISVFSFLLGVSIVLGYHIVIEGSAYSGLMGENYISAYAIVDALALILIPLGLYPVLSSVFQLLKNSCEKQQGICQENHTSLEKVSFGSIIAFAAILFLAWIPYLLTYWPGFIFGDSLASLRQASGLVPWDNHFPIMYTFFIKACLDVSTMIGLGPTEGCAIYSIVQMLFMALCFGYLSNWIVVRTKLKKEFWGIALVALFAFTPYIATYTVSMWKDPIFSASLVILTLLLMDFALSNGRVVKTDRSWLFKYVAFSLLAIFSRNNGLYIVAFVGLCLLVLFLYTHRRNAVKNMPRVLGATAIVLAVSFVITGPIYKYAGVDSDGKVESFGILLSQMSRVAASGGDMSEADREYMNALLPLDMYASAYRPCCIDLLKWDRHFDKSVLENDFFAHWESMFVRNPVVCFEAWELQTCGFWTVNQPNVNSFDRNIAAGTPRNTVTGYEDSVSALNIELENRLQSDRFYKLFPQDEWSIPLGLIHWSLLFLAMCLALLNRRRWLLSLAPSLGVALTLVVASPIWYWPRYGAVEQFLIPFYVAVLVLLVQTKMSARFDSGAR